MSLGCRVWIVVSVEPGCMSIIGVYTVERDARSAKPSDTYSAKYFVLSSELMS